MLKKILAIFIITAVVLAYLISCSNKDTGNEAKPTENNKDPNSNSVVETDENVPAVDLLATDYLPEQDYGGDKFTIITLQDVISSLDMFIVEEQTGEVVSDAIYKRNLNIENRFNIKLKSVGMAYDQTSGAVNKSVKAGDHAYDLLAVHSVESCGPLLNKNLVYNWLNVPDVNLQKPWYSQSISELMEIGGFLPFIVSDICYGSYLFSFGMAFNKSYVENYGIENPYDLVRSGDWTLDKFGEMVKMFGEDVNGDGIYDENDSYGYATPKGFYWNMLYSTGNLCVQKTADNQLELTLYNEKMITLIDKLYDILWVGNHTYQWEHLDPRLMLPIDQNRSFIQGLWFHDLPSMRGMEVDFGIIPYPKFDKQQEKYLTTVDARGTVLALPINTPDIEKAGIIVEALSAESRRYVVPAYYDIALTHKDLRDEESSEMLDIIFAGRVYDIGYMYDSGMIWLMNELLESKKTDFVSTYEKREASYQKFYDKIAEQYQIAIDEQG